MSIERSTQLHALSFQLRDALSAGDLLVDDGSKVLLSTFMLTTFGM